VQKLNTSLFCNSGKSCPSQWEKKIGNDVPMPVEEWFESDRSQLNQNSLGSTFPAIGRGTGQHVF